jgi:hypothetical protein
VGGCLCLCPSVSVSVWVWVWVCWCVGVGVGVGVGSRKARVVEPSKVQFLPFLPCRITQLTCEETLPVAHHRSKERIASGGNA